MSQDLFKGGLIYTEPLQLQHSPLGVHHLKLTVIVFLPFRALQGHLSSDCHVGNSVSNVQHQHKPDASEVASERVTHYLRSLMQPGATAKERTPQKSPTTVPRGGQAAENTGRSNPFLPLELADKDLPGGPLSTSVLSQCDVESLCSDWSMRSGSTFNTKDEAAFRDGLSALDASIANLMKTLQLDREKSCTWSSFHKKPALSIYMNACYCSCALYLTLIVVLTQNTAE